MRRTLQQSVVLPASPARLYAMYLNSKTHAAITGELARIGRKRGAAFRAFGGTLIGVALYPQGGSDMTALLKCADIATYRAKQAGGNNYHFFMESKQRKLSLPAMQRE